MSEVNNSAANSGAEGSPPATSSAPTSTGNEASSPTPVPTTAAPGSVDALRAELGLPAREAPKVEAKTDPKGTAAATAETASKPDAATADTEVKDDSEYASRVARLARIDRESKQRLAEVTKLKETVEAKEKELHGAAADAQARKEAIKLFSEGKRREAIQRALGLDAIPEDLFADLATSPEAKPLDKADVDKLVEERLKAALEAQGKEAEAKAKAEEAQRAKVIEDYEAEQVNLAVETFETEAKKWPLLHKLAAKGEQEQEFITSKYVKVLRNLAGEGKDHSPGQVFDQLEKDYADLVGEPATKTISADLKKGSQVAAEPELKAEDRWKKRDLDKEAFLRERAKERGLRWE